MPRKEPITVDHRERKRQLDNFWTMVALLETRDEVRNFFKDLLSATEALMLARRIEIAQLLLHGLPYEKIAKQLGSANATIASVHRWLQGGFGGYLSALPKLEKEIQRQQKVSEKKEEAYIPFSKEWMRRKYPLHYLLSSMLGENLTAPKKLKK